MNYRRIYTELIMRAWRRDGVEGYKERHHIIPRCQGGGNDKANLVDLTASEHYIAHLLLVKMYPDNGKLITAAFMMSHKEGKFINNKLYANLRNSYSSISKIRQTGVPVSQEARDKIAQAHRGFKHSEETKKLLSIKNSGYIVPEYRKKKISNTLKGRKFSEEHKSKIADANRRREWTIEMRQNMSNSLKGRKFSDEWRSNMSASRKGRNAWNKGKKMPPEAVAKANISRAKTRERKKMLLFWCAL